MAVDASDPGLAEILEEVRRIDLQSRRLVTDVMAGSYVSVFRGAGLEFDGVREYADGDDPRLVDWNVTARVGRPFVKTYTEERELTVLFLLDLSASMSGGFGIWSARQTAARVCGCLALAATKNDDKVGLIAFSDQVETFVTPRKGVSHAMRIVRDCLALPARSETTDLVPALELASRAVRRHAVVFVVSDFLSSGWEQAMSLCARRHDVIAVRLLTPELAPRAAGLVRFVDPESGRRIVVDTASRRARERYAAYVEQWDARSRQALRQAKVDRMDVPVPRRRSQDMIAGPILRFFRIRELRGAKR